MKILTVEYYDRQKHAGEAVDDTGKKFRFHERNNRSHSGTRLNEYVSEGASILADVAEDPCEGLYVAAYRVTHGDVMEKFFAHFRRLYQSADDVPLAGEMVITKDGRKMRLHHPMDYDGF